MGIAPFTANFCTIPKLLSLANFSSELPHKKDNMRYKLLIVGAGGFGQETVWAVRNLNGSSPVFEIVGFCDDDLAMKGNLLYGYSVLGRPEDIDTGLSSKPRFVCAIGNNRARMSVVARVLALGWLPITVIDPSVIVAEGVDVGVGTYIGAGSILSPHARIGNYVIVNHLCSIGHDSIVEDFAQIAPGGRISGNCIVKEGAYIGSNAVINQGRTIGRYATLGACSFAVHDIPDGITAVGVPATSITKQ